MAGCSSRSFSFSNQLFCVLFVSFLDWFFLLEIILRSIYFIPFPSISVVNVLKNTQSLLETLIF